MSYTSYALNDSFTVKLWEKDLAVAERAYLPIQPLIGKSSNNIIQFKTSSSKGAGDQITYGLRARLLGAGFSENQLAEGNGEALTTYSDQLTINELGHVVGVKSKNTIDQQRVPYDLREEARDGLTEWWGDRLSMSFFAQVCGYTAQSDVRFTGMVAPVAPSANRWLRAASRSADENITNADTFTLDLIDSAVALAKVGDDKQRVRPLKIKGRDKYVVYLHPWQVKSLRTNTNTGQWLDITKFALSGGVNQSDSPLYTGALGEYNGCILRESQDVTHGVNSSTGVAIATTRRAVLLGAQACAIGYGRQAGRPNKYRWNEELFDHKRRLEVSAWAIFGMKKMVFNSQDFGTVVITSYSNASDS